MSNFTTRELAKGETLYQAGDLSSKFYFLLNGKVNLTESESEKQPLKVLDEGQFFGFCYDA